LRGEGTKEGGGSEENKKITNKKMYYIRINLSSAPLSTLPLLGMLAILICSVCVMLKELKDIPGSGVAG
jgi:hypothetical protein